jgi:hypothetical protein
MYGAILPTSLDGNERRNSFHRSCRRSTVRLDSFRRNPRCGGQERLAKQEHFYPEYFRNPSMALMMYVLATMNIMQI